MWRRSTSPGSTRRAREAREPLTGSRSGQRRLQRQLVVQELDEDRAGCLQQVAYLGNADRVADLSAGPGLRHQPRPAEDAQLLGQVALLDVDLAEKLVHGTVALAQQLEHADARGVPEGAEEV